MGDCRKLDVEEPGLNGELCANRTVVFEDFGICLKAVDTANGRRKINAIFIRYIDDIL